MGLDKGKDQHIMLDSDISEMLVSSASIQEDDEILEIGGGPGNLTRLLAKHAAKVYTVEKDKKYFSILKRKFDDTSNVRPIFGDILDVELPRFNKIVSNPPYQILQQFFIRLVNERKYGFDCCVMFVPHNFAKIITTKPESDGFGALSALFYAFYNVEALGNVPKQAFEPMPRVTSHIVRIIPKDNEQKGVRALLTSIFLEDKKSIRNAIISTLWNDGEKCVGKRFTKKQAKEAVGRVSLELSSILDKNIFQLSNSEIRVLYKCLESMN